MKLKRQGYLKRMLCKNSNQHRCYEVCLMKLNTFTRKTHFMSDTRDQRPGTLKVEPETQDHCLLRNLEPKNHDLNGP